MQPATRHADAARLQERIMVLARDKRALEDENAKLRAELAATMLPYKGHTLKIIGGVPTIFLNGGGVYEFVTVAIDRIGESGYERKWQPLASIPTSPAERIDAVAPALCEMGVVGDEMGIAS
jgi:hypothetical protein